MSNVKKIREFKSFRYCAIANFFLYFRYSNFSSSCLKITIYNSIESLVLIVIIYAVMLSANVNKVFFSCELNLIWKWKQFVFCCLFSVFCY